MKRTRRSAVRAAALVAAGCLLAGCVSVPHSGRVVVPGNGATSSVHNGQPEARIEAAPPVDGEQPIQIVRDFYNAMVDYDNEYAVAKKYLTKAALRPWTPGATRAVVVLDVADPLPTPGSATTFTMQFAKVGEVLGDHEFVDAQQSTEVVTDTLRVVRDPDDRNEWRIASGAPDALRLSIADFNTVYHEATLYFPRTAKGLPPVAERRWFAARRDELPGEVAAAYAKGPSAFLAADPTVAPLFPIGASAVHTDPTALGNAALGFTVPPQSMTDGLESSLVKALQMTFRADSSDFTNIDVTVNGVLHTEALGSASPEVTKPETVLNSWFIDSKLVLRPWVDAGAPAGVDDVPPQFDVKGMLPDTVSLSPAPDAMFAAGDAVQPDGTHALRLVARDVGRKDVLLRASSLASFTWSVDGQHLWVAGAVNGVPTLWYVTIRLFGDGRSASYSVVEQPVAIDTELTRDGRTLVDVRPSPDGVRISAIVREHGGKAGVLYVGRVDLTQSTPSVVFFRRVAPVLMPPVPVSGKPLTVAPFTVARALWEDAESLVVLASSSNNSYQLANVTVDGTKFTLKNTAGAPPFQAKTGLAGAKDANLLAIDPSPKRLGSELTDAGWVPIRKRTDKAGVLAILYPG